MIILNILIINDQNILLLPCVYTGCIAVFSTTSEGSDKKVIAVAEVRKALAEDEIKQLQHSLKLAVAQAFNGFDLHEVVLVKDHTIPKTSSGKIMRYACRYNYLNAALARLDSQTFSKRIVDKMIQVCWVFPLLCVAS